MKTFSRKTRKNNKEKEKFQRCHHFCENAYLEKKKSTIKQLYKHLTNREINKKLKNLDKKTIINDCKLMYCNPKCPNIRKDLPYHYFCCKENSEKAKKMGAITQCMRDYINL
jgi:hypothetical protein